MTTKTKTPPYQLKLKIMGKTYASKGKTVTEALQKLEIRNARGHGVLQVTKGKDVVERILTGFQITRMFNLSPTIQEVTRKQVSNLFNL